MKLKLDENLGHAAADLFLQAGHEIETAFSEGLSGARDEDIIAACQREQRGLVTLDLDFSNPLVFKPSEYAGIAVLWLPAKPSHEDLLTVCRTLLRAIERDSRRKGDGIDEKGTSFIITCVSAEFVLASNYIVLLGSSDTAEPLVGLGQSVAG